LTAHTLETGDERQVSLPEAKRAGSFPENYVLQSCPCTGDLIEGAEFTFGNLSLRVIETPGHAAGHVSFLVQGDMKSYLLQGDVIFFGGTVFLQNTHDCSIQEYARSVDKLAELEFDAHLPGHLGITLDDGKRHILAAKATFDALGVPKNLV
jgi:glyoxylase-like metal-dependent hydrolase (beta-lactamase superfamily II)